MKMILANAVFYGFLFFTAYFVTPNVLWTLLVVQGFTERKQKVKKGEQND